MTWQQIIAGYMPALVIMATVYIAAVSNNKRIDDVNKRIDDLRTDMRDLRMEMKDLRAEMRDGFRKLEERFEHPIPRP